MSGINKAIVVGNLGQDPQLNYTQDGRTIATLSIATSDVWNDRASGERKEKTEWHRVVIFGKLADIAKQYLKKGSKVYVEGKIQTRKWQDKSGQDRYSTEIVLQGYNTTLQMLDSRGSDGGQSSVPFDDGNQTSNSQPTEVPVVEDDFDDDIPF